MLILGTTSLHKNWSWTPRCVFLDAQLPKVSHFTCSLLHSIETCIHQKKEFVVNIQSTRLGVISRALQISDVFLYSLQGKLEFLQLVPVRQEAISRNAMRPWRRKGHHKCSITNITCSVILKELFNLFDFILTCSRSTVCITMRNVSSLQKWSLTRIIPSRHCESFHIVQRTLHHVSVVACILWCADNILSHFLNGKRYGRECTTIPFISFRGVEKLPTCVSWTLQAQQYIIYCFSISTKNICL